jgi:DNA-directed RNA polymerase specialized sigma24 family protein
MSLSTHSVTQMLHDWAQGDSSAFDRLVPLVEKELRRQAARYLRMEQPGHTLQTADLIQEAYLRLMDTENIQWQNRAHFFGIAANLMRRILVDYARKRQAKKRDWAGIGVSVMDPRQGRVVELRYFAGLSVEETARILGVSTKTVKRDWQMAKVWLREEIKRK